MGVSACAGILKHAFTCMHGWYAVGTLVIHLNVYCRHIHTEPQLHIHRAQMLLMAGVAGRVEAAVTAKKFLPLYRFPLKPEEQH